MIKVVFFDLGNTLMYFDAPQGEILDQADRAMVKFIASAGYDLNAAQFLNEFKTRIHEYYHERDTDLMEYTSEYVLRQTLAVFGYPDPPQEHIKQALIALYSVTQTYWQPEADAVSTLRQLKSDHLRLGLISNASDANDVDALIDKGNFCPFFDQILVSAAVGYRKPHPRMFELALDFFKVAPHETVMVGDTLDADILGANRMGIHSIWITRRVPAPHNLGSQTARPTAMITALNQLPEMIRDWPDSQA